MLLLLVSQCLLSSGFVDCRPEPPHLFLVVPSELFQALDLFLCLSLAQSMKRQTLRRVVLPESSAGRVRAGAELGEAGALEGELAWPAVNSSLSLAMADSADELFTLTANSSFFFFSSRQSVAQLLKVTSKIRFAVAPILTLAEELSESCGRIASSSGCCALGRPCSSA